MHNEVRVGGPREEEAEILLMSLEGQGSPRKEQNVQVRGETKVRVEVGGNRILKDQAQKQGGFQAWNSARHPASPIHKPRLSLVLNVRRLASCLTNALTPSSLAESFRG